MENQIESRKTQTKPENFWSQSEQEELLKTLAVIVTGQKAYGKDVSVADTWAYYKLKLNGRFPASDVLQALDKYTDRKGDIPAPADLITIMSPDAVRVSQAEFIHAKDQWAKENYPTHSYYAQIVRQYEKENHEERAKVEAITDPKVLQLIQSSVKKIA